jgi:hypothetical protein
LYLLFCCEAHTCSEQRAAQKIPLYIDSKAVKFFKFLPIVLLLPVTFNFQSEENLNFKITMFCFLSSVLRAGQGLDFHCRTSLASHSQVRMRTLSGSTLLLISCAIIPSFLRVRLRPRKLSLFSKIQLY